MSHLVGLGAMLGGCLIVQRDVQQLRQELSERRASDLKMYRSRWAILSEHTIFEPSFWAAILWVPSKELSLRMERRRARVLSAFLLLSLIVSVSFAASGVISDTGVALGIISCFMGTYAVSRTQYLRAAMWMTIVTVFGFPYLYRGVLGPKVFESASLLNLVSQTSMALLGCALFTPTEFVVVSVAELALLLWNPFFHPQFALAIVLPFIAFVSFLDQRDLKRTRSKFREPESTENPSLEKRHSSHQVAEFDFHNHHVSAKSTYSIATACLLGLLALCVASLIEGRSGGKHFSGKTVAASETVIHWRYGSAPFLKVYKHPQCRYPSSNGTEPEHFVADDDVAEGNWCDEQIYTVSFTVKACSATAGQRYYVTCSRGSFYGWYDRPLCPFSDTMALFCVPEDVGGDCRAHVEIGLDNFKAWENPTCDFAGNMKFKVAQSDPAAAGGIDDDEDEDVWAEEPVVYVGDTGITETSTKSSHTTPASFGSSVAVGAPRHFDVSNKTDGAGSGRRLVIDSIHPSVRFLFAPWGHVRRVLWRTTFNWASLSKSVTSLNSLSAFELDEPYTVSKDYTDFPEEVEKCETSVPTVSPKTVSRFPSLGPFGGRRTLLSHRRQLNPHERQWLLLVIIYQEVHQ